MSKFVIDIKAIDDRLVIVNARNGIELYEIEVNDSEGCEGDRLIDRLDEGIRDVLQYRETVMNEQKEKATLEAADTAKSADNSTDKVIRSSVDYFKEVSKVMAAYPDVFTLSSDIAMKNIVDMAIQFNVDSYELGTTVYAYMEERRKMLNVKLLNTLFSVDKSRKYPQ